MAKDFNYTVYITQKAFLDKILIYSDRLGTVTRRDLKRRNEDAELIINFKINKKAPGVEFEYQNRTAVIKSHAARLTK